MQEDMRVVALRHARLCLDMNYTILESTREIFVMIVMMKKSSNFDFILTQIEFYIVHV